MRWLVLRNPELCGWGLQKETALLPPSRKEAQLGVLGMGRVLPREGRPRVGEVGWTDQWNESPGEQADPKHSAPSLSNLPWRRTA